MSGLQSYYPVDGFSEFPANRVGAPNPDSPPVDPSLTQPSGRTVAVTEMVGHVLAVAAVAAGIFAIVCLANGTTFGLPLATVIGLEFGSILAGVVGAATLISSGIRSCKSCLENEEAAVDDSHPAVPLEKNATIASLPQQQQPNQSEEISGLDTDSDLNTDIAFTMSLDRFIALSRSEQDVRSLPFCVAVALRQSEQSDSDLLDASSTGIGYGTDWEVEVKKEDVRKNFQNQHSGRPRSLSLPGLSLPMTVVSMQSAYNYETAGKEDDAVRVEEIRWTRGIPMTSAELAEQQARSVSKNDDDDEKIPEVDEKTSGKLAAVASTSSPVITEAEPRSTIPASVPNSISGVNINKMTKDEFLALYEQTQERIKALDTQLNQAAAFADKRYEAAHNIAKAISPDEQQGNLRTTSLTRLPTIGGKEISEAEANAIIEEYTKLKALQERLDEILSARAEAADEEYEENLAAQQQASSSSSAAQLAASAERPSTPVLVPTSNSHQKDVDTNANNAVYAADASEEPDSPSSSAGSRNSNSSDACDSCGIVHSKN